MKSLKNNFALVIFLIFVCSCTSKQKFEHALENENCEEALNVVPENESSYQLISKTKQTSGYVLSYTLTGAAYTAEALLFVGAGISYILISCAPVAATIMALEMASGGTGVPSQIFSPNLCIAPYEKFDVSDERWGENTYKGTKQMRCPDLDGLSRSIRKVATCYQNRGTAEANQKALTTLRALENSGSFFACVSSTEREKVLAQARDLEQNQ